MRYVFLRTALTYMDEAYVSPYVGILTVCRVLTLRYLFALLLRNAVDDGIVDTQRKEHPPSMQTANPVGDEPNCVVVLARALGRSGKVKVSRKERLQLALIDLRDRIHGEFVRVAKSWQVSAQELRRECACYGFLACPSQEPHEIVRGK